MLSLGNFQDFFLFFFLKLDFKLQTHLPKQVLGGLDRQKKASHSEWTSQIALVDSITQ